MKNAFICFMLSVLGVNVVYGQAVAPNPSPQVALVEEEELFFEEEQDLEETDLEEFEEI